MNRARTAVLGLLAVLLGGAAAAGIAARATADRQPRVGENVMVNRAGVIEAHNSPSLARNPRSPANVVAPHRIDRPPFSSVLNWSKDGGGSWRSTPLPLPPGLDRPYAADAAFGADGTLYVTYVNLEGSGNVPANLWIARSTDGGRTLSRPRRVAGKLSFQARVVAGPGQTVYVTWLKGGEVGLFQLLGTSPVVAARSDDGGRTFAPAVQVSDPSRERVGAASPVIDSHGKLVVLYEDFKDDRRDFQNLEGPPWERPFSLVVTRPVGTRAFSRGVVVNDDLRSTHRFLVFVPDFPSLAAGPGDALYAAWYDGRNGDEDVFLSRSANGGASWSAPKRVNDNPKGDGTSQYLPRVDVSPDGRVDVLFLDRRRDRKDVMTDATLASSDDGGDSFTNARISSRSFSSRIGASASPKLPIDFGSRLGLLSENGRSLAAWTDTRRGSIDTGRQDIFAARYTVPDPPGGLSSLPAIAALALLSLAVGGYAFAAAGRR